MRDGITRKLAIRLNDHTRIVCQLMVVGAVSMSALPDAAHAQDDVQGRSVSQRSADEYASSPVHIGPFDAFPSVELTTEYTDNALITQANGRQDDVIFTLTPRLRLRDQRSDRVVDIDLSAGIRKFASIDTEDSEQLRFSARGMWGLGTATQYSGAVRVNRSTEDRRDVGSFNSVLQPIAFTDMSAEAGVDQALGPVRVSLNGAARAVRYDGLTTIGSEQFDLSFRNFEVYRATSRIRYARSRDREVYLQLTVDDRSYDPAPTTSGGQPLYQFDRSSRGGRLELGYRQQITELLYLDLRAGYLLREYDDPALDDTDGLAFQADLLWNVTPLTSIEFSGQRRVDETINPLVSGLVRTEGRVQIEHELLRNLILTGRGAYARLDRLDSDNDGDQWSVGAEANYRLDRHWEINLRAEHYERTGFYDFAQNEVGIGLRFNF
ncbi:outer membrane beta-barrel protein [Aurantiacibacter suaedae]|uniref:outer membrane beta-barrel protein n=1 Tax=Aurantiacibacter suaedae TaxID=2545755 RepID=UPI0010F516EA|nr:outer membrane beta-barrel protein [Aurantiacibacter suaedae]